MFEGVFEQINGVLSITIGGVSITTIIGMVITLIVQIRKLHKENKLTKEYIESAFNNAVLPKTVKLDLSKKIEQPLKDGFTNMTRLIEDTLSKVQNGERLILMILSEFSHIHKLSPEVQAEISEYVEKETSVTVSLETDDE